MDGVEGVGVEVGEGLGERREEVIGEKWGLFERVDLRMEKGLEG